MTKDQWRKLGKEARKALSSEERLIQTNAICNAITTDPRWQRAKTVLLFLSFGSEWDTTPLIEDAWANDKTVALTVCYPDHQMKPCLYTPDTPLVTALGSLREIPQELATPIDINSIDFCLIPGLLFDPYGTRLGYGAGYYDRFLPKLPEHCTMLAAGFNCQFVGAALPYEATDYHVPEIITPAKRIKTRMHFSK